MHVLSGDAKELLVDIYPDVLVTDPPFGNHVHKRATSQSAGGGARHRELGFAHLSNELREWTCQLAARTKRWSVIFSDLESISLWKYDLEDAGATYVRTIVWTRWSMPQLSGDRPPQGAEAIIIAYGANKGRKKWNGPGNLTHFSQGCLRGEGKHKCEKPLDLMLDLVEFFSNPGELVVDPFAGSGTTGLACKLLGRDFTGAELDFDWAAKANARISNYDRLSVRDLERWERYQDRRCERANDAERRKKINQRARAANGGF